MADFEAIRQRYFRNGMSNYLTNDQIIGLYNYFNEVADQFINKGPEKKEEWPTYAAIGSWLSLALKTSYSQVYDVVNKWTLTRYLAARVNDDGRNCTDFVNPVLKNLTRSEIICHDFDFTAPNMSGIFYFANAPNYPEV